MDLLKQSTAVDVTILMIDSGDHVSGKTGLSAGLTIYASKAAGTPATITPTVTELDSTNVPGLYKLAFTTTHTNTLGELQLHITASGADPTDVNFQVLANLPGELSATSIQAIWDALTSALTTASSVGKLLVDNINAPISSRLPTSSYTAPLDSSATISAVNSALDAAGAELSSVPGATGTLRQKINAIFQYLIFKRTTTSATETLYKADSATSLGTSTVSDDGTTATHGKVS